MKMKFLKPLVVVAMAAAFWACSDDSSSSAKQELVVSSDAWHLVEDGNDYIIYPGTNVVTDASGNVIGSFASVDGTTGAIINADGSILVATVDLSTLEVVHPSGLVPEDQIVVNAPAWHIIDGENDYIIYPEGYIVTDAYGKVIGTFVPVEGTTSGSIVDSEGKTLVETTDLAAATILEPKPIAPESSSSVDNPIPQQSSSSDNPQEKPSSSSVRSSSSVVRSSSSSVIKSSSSSQTPTSTTIEYIAGGKSGSGWATRYWDCCKPHCAWPDKGGLKAHACDAQGNRINDDGATSMCDGGNSGTCRNQIPIVVNDTLAYAFAAVPGSAGGECGKCFDLAFTGKGKYSTDNHTKLKGKHLIVIASNIGYDVEQGQFDVMIPGGGYGIFDGCSSKMGWGPQGERYGGLLSQCENESGYKAGTYKSCLTNKCNSSFSSDPIAKEGCLFLANWMNAAGNPLHEFKEVKCPQALLDKF